MKLCIVTLVLVLVFALGASARGVFEAKAFGAKGDGLHDDTAAIQAALDAAGKVHGVAYLSTGTYLITRSLQVPDGTLLEGEGARWENGAVTIQINQPGFPAVVLHNVSSLKGVCFNYPNNADDSAPVPYPPTIELRGINPSVEDVVFNNAYIGVSTAAGGSNAGQALFRNLTGFVHAVGMHLSGPLDIVRIENVHWFVGGDTSKGQWFRQRRVGFEFGRVDGVMMSKCFMIGGKTFVHQLPQADAPEGQPKPGAHSLSLFFNECWVENVKYGFLFEGACGFAIDNSQILIGDPEGCGIKVTPGSLYYGAMVSNTQIRMMPHVAALGIYYSCKRPHPRNELLVSNCQICDGAPAIELGPGAQRAIIRGCHLMGGSDSVPVVKIAEGADYFQLVNNFIQGKHPLEDESGTAAHKVIRDNLMP